MKKRAIILFLLLCCILSGYSRQAMTNSQEEMMIYLYVGVAVILLCALVLLALFCFYRIRYLKQKKINLKQEEAAAALQARLEEVEARRLQQEILIGNLQLEYKSQLLDDLVRNASIKKDEVERILNKDLRIDNNFDDFKRRLKNIHPDFYNRLQVRAKPRLTALDMKYCVCIFMNMSSKETADMLHIETKTVRMAKYRMKQKLNLAKDDDLGEFIRHII